MFFVAKIEKYQQFLVEKRALSGAMINGVVHKKSNLNKFNIMMSSEKEMTIKALAGYLHSGFNLRKENNCSLLIGRLQWGIKHCIG